MVDPDLLSAVVLMVAHQVADFEVLQETNHPVVQDPDHPVTHEVDDALNGPTAFSLLPKPILVPDTMVSPALATLAMTLP